MNLKELNKAVEDKLVSIQKHPTSDLYIYNYTPRVQYDRLWDEITLGCRGLILDGNGNIVANCMKKFFNLEEHKPEEIPVLPFEVFEKVDGSLGILYWLDNKPYVATRGSFISDQAIKGTEILYSKYSHLFDMLNRNHTYLFEIIYPENRIVLDYNGLEDLILLTVLDENGKDIQIPDIGFNVVKRYDGIKDIATLKSLEEDNKEGFVVRFENGFRVKVKFDEYCRLHRIVTGVSNLTIWEHLSEERNLEELLDRVPDEFYKWVKQTAFELNSKFLDMSKDCHLAITNHEFPINGTRKEQAEYIKKQPYPSVLFSMLDDKIGKNNYYKLIWKIIRPKFSKPFKQND